MEQHRVCPWWMGYLLANPLRRLYQDPAKILSPYLKPGMTVLEPGPGMGFFTLAMGRLVESSGRVIALDLQPKMLSTLQARAARAGLSDRIETRLAPADSMKLQDLRGRIDFVLAFAVVHEFPSVERFFAESAEALKPGGRLLLAEPRGHVDAAHFAEELELARRAGLTLLERPEVRGSHTALFAK